MRGTRRLRVPTANCCDRRRSKTGGCISVKRGHLFAQCVAAVRVVAYDSHLPRERRSEPSQPVKWKGISGIPRGAVWCKRVDLVTASLGEGRLTDIFPHPAFIEIVASSSNQAMLHMRTSTLPLAGAGDAPLRPACMGGKETPVWFCVSLRLCTTATCSASGGYSCTCRPCTFV